MNKHAYYQELISRLLDEDNSLTAEEKDDLQAHLDGCEECSAMYRAFAALSDSLSGELDDPPESLRENVMAEIRREQIRERNRLPFRWSSLVAVAAVLALVIGFAPRFFSSRAGSTAVKAEMASGAMFSAEDEQYNSFEEPGEERETQSADAGTARNAAGSDEDTTYITMDTEAAAAAEAAPVTEEDEGHYVIFGADVTEDGEPGEYEAWLEENAADKLSMSALLFCLDGRPTDLDPEELPLSPLYLIDTDSGVLEIYRYRGGLYYYDPMSGALYEADCSENDLIRFLAG